MGQVSQGDLQFVGTWGVAPIQCEGFLCSVVFLTPKGSGSLGETKAATEAFLAPLPVYAMPPRRQLERGGVVWPTQGPASGAHGA